MTQHILKCFYLECCILRRSAERGDEDRSAPVHIHGWNSSGGDGEVAGSADESERDERLGLAAGGDRIVPNFCFSFAKPAAESTKRSGKNEVQILTDTLFDNLFAVEELCPHGRKGENCECLVKKRTYDALSKKRLQKEKPRKAYGCSLSGAIFYKKNTLNATRERKFLTTSDFSLQIRRLSSSDAPS